MEVYFGFGSTEREGFEHFPIGTAVQRESMVVLILFTFVLVARRVVDVVPYLAEAFVVAEDVFDIDVIASHGFNFIRQDAVRTHFWRTNRWCLFVCFLARSQSQCCGQYHGKIQCNFCVHFNVDFWFCFSEALKRNSTHRP